jgi:hypothetical protein
MNLRSHLTISINTFLADVTPNRDGSYLLRYLSTVNLSYHTERLIIDTVHKRSVSYTAYAISINTFF